MTHIDIDISHCIALIWSSLAQASYIPPTYSLQFHSATIFTVLHIRAHFTVGIECWVSPAPCQARESVVHCVRERFAVYCAYNFHLFGWRYYAYSS